MMLLALLLAAAGRCPMIMDDVTYGPGGVDAPDVVTLDAC
jgi:hypothetical protein